MSGNKNLDYLITITIIATISNYHYLFGVVGIVVISIARKLIIKIETINESER